ncbi:MAG: fructose-bisphosphatase class I [Campylobacterota bacterium]|nr:fructose-bisphosphatase class I [Campylobacterota bacterium]
MNNILELIKKIAIDIEKNIFNNYEDRKPEKVYEICTDIVKKHSLKISDIKSIVSKDKKEIEILNNDGKYILTYVSIDNVTLLDMNFSLGTIFTIYKDSIESKNIIISSYVTYGPTFQIVFATKENGIEFYSYDEKEFKQTESFKLNNKGKINSMGGDVTNFLPKHKELMQNFFNDGYRLRFSDSLALDTHQILFKKGGIYSQPKTATNKDGKLDLVFEAYPISFIVKLAGGEAIDDSKNNILDIVYDGDISKKTPIYFGSANEIEKVKTFL